MSTYEEWRVTGNPGPGFPPYTFTWTTRPDARGRVTSNAEVEARDFARLMREHDSWTDGPHLHRRTVTTTEWVDGDEPVDEHVELRHQIIQNGPYVDGHADMFGGRTPTWQEANDLRRDLLDLGILREQAETCTCGHGMLHEMFHLMPCPIAARRIARRKASKLTEEDV